jgi:hypothetical protein
MWGRQFPRAKFFLARELDAGSAASESSTVLNSPYPDGYSGEGRPLESIVSLNKDVSGTWVKLLVVNPEAQSGFEVDNCPVVIGWSTNNEELRSLRALISLSLAEPERCIWLSSVLSGNVGQRERSKCAEASLSEQSNILCLIPHFACEEFLDRCLSSLSKQTRPLDAIAVIDDASLHPPVEIVRRYANVTLLQSESRIGPYRLCQSVIDATEFDGYLIQDADDWSTVDRLELLLAEAERTGAELVGCQEYSVSMFDASIRPGVFPLDVNDVLRKSSVHSLLHGTSLISRRLIAGIGGFASGLQYGADTEFLFRSHFSYTVRNIPQFCYFRTVRPGSLTTSPLSGTDSPGRQRVRARILERASENRIRLAQGERPILTPLEVAPSVALHHLHGPHLL